MAGMTGRRNVVWKTPEITAFGLKLFAGAAMLLQTIGITVVQNGIIHLNSYTQEELSQAMAADSALMTQAGIGSVLQLFGGLAVPVFAFLLVEGFLNTSSYKNYLISMAVFALLSEIPYDYAVSQKLIDWSSQNALVTMCICLLMLYFLRMGKERGGAAGGFLQVLIVLCAIAWVTVFRSAYGLCMVLLAAVFYIFYTRNVLKTVLGVIVSLLYVTGPLSFYPIWCYNGERKDKFSKYVYYAFYPLHLLVLGLLANIFMA